MSIVYIILILYLLHPQLESDPSLERDAHNGAPHPLIPVPNNTVPVFQVEEEELQEQI